MRRSQKPQGLGDDELSSLATCPYRPPSHVELARGIEPPTCGLQNRCSAVELRQRPRASAMYGSILHYGEHYLACAIARSTATKQSRCSAGAEGRDCFASLAITGFAGN